VGRVEVDGEVVLEVEQPELWWPNGFGEQRDFASLGVNAYRFSIAWPRMRDPRGVEYYDALLDVLLESSSRGRCRTGRPGGAGAAAGRGAALEAVDPEAAAASVRSSDARAAAASSRNTAPCVRSAACRVRRSC
jgi:hypothetical protein